LRRLRALFVDPLFVPQKGGMVPASKAFESIEMLRRSLDQLRSTGSGHHHFSLCAAASPRTPSLFDHKQLFYKSFIMRLKCMGSGQLHKLPSLQEPSGAMRPGTYPPATVSDDRPA